MMNPRIRDNLVLFLTPFYEFLSYIFGVFRVVGIVCIIVLLFLGIWVLQCIDLILKKLVRLFGFNNLKKKNRRLHANKLKDEKNLKTGTKKRILSGEDDAICCMTCDLSKYANSDELRMLPGPAEH